MPRQSAQIPEALSSESGRSRSQLRQVAWFSFWFIGLGATVAPLLGPPKWDFWDPSL